MNRAAKVAVWLLVGALSFWLPILVVFAVGHSSTNMFVANGLGVLGAAVGCAVMRKAYRSERFAIWMLIGLYFFGPILYEIVGSFAGGGFSQVHGWESITWLVLACIFPPFELWMVGVAGFWPGLLAATAVFGGIAVSQSRSILTCAGEHRDARTAA